jgi:hypothetical protein
MKFISSIIILIIIKLSLSDLNSNEEKFKNLEKKTKILSCSYLSKLFLDSVKDKDKLLKDIMKDKSDLNESETKERITQFLLMNCYLKITKELIMEVTMNLM